MRLSRCFFSGGQYPDVQHTLGLSLNSCEHINIPLSSKDEPEYSLYYVEYSQEKKRKLLALPDFPLFPHCEYINNILPSSSSGESRLISSPTRRYCKGTTQSMYVPVSAFVVAVGESTQPDDEVLLLVASCPFVKAAALCCASMQSCTFTAAGGALTRDVAAPRWIRANRRPIPRSAKLRNHRKLAHQVRLNS